MLRLVFYKTSMPTALIMVRCDCMCDIYLHQPWVAAAAGYMTQPSLHLAYLFAKLLRPVNALARNGLTSSYGIYYFFGFQPQSDRVTCEFGV